MNVGSKQKPEIPLDLVVVAVFVYWRRRWGCGWSSEEELKNFFAKFLN